MRHRRVLVAAAIGIAAEPAGGGLLYIVHPGLWLWTNAPLLAVYAAELLTVLLWVAAAAAALWYRRCYRASLPMDLAVSGSSQVAEARGTPVIHARKAEGPATASLPALRLRSRREQTRGRGGDRDHDAGASPDLGSPGAG